MPAAPPGRSADRDMLRFVACGSVDAGKSTLIGRLMAETASVPDDQMAALAGLSRRYGTTGADLDYALLLDGLEAEREQKITIDVAYRYFRTERRAFLVADTPGHEQYTRNMVTGASNADLALLLVDARSGLTQQTMRHSRIVSLVGIRSVVLVINKMDLVDYSQRRFAEVVESFRNFSAELQFTTVQAVPISGRRGDNITAASGTMAWYGGPTVLQHLENVQAKPAQDGAAARFFVQSAVRPDSETRSYAGFVASGQFARGERIVVPRSGRGAAISRIYTFDGELERAVKGQAVNIDLDAEIDVGRGDVLTPSNAQPHVADQMAAQIVWLDEQPLLAGRTYQLLSGTQSVPATVTTLKHRIDVETGQHLAAPTLVGNDIGFCNVSTATPITFDAYGDNRATGSFVLVDRDTAATVGAGMMAFPLYRASNIRRQSYEIDKKARAHMKAQRPCIVWFTGLSGAGKSTIMNLVEQELASLGAHTYALDGDNLRFGLNRDLGFTDADRVENIRRAGEVARLMVDAGLVVLCAFISPFRNDRQAIREKVGENEFIEVYVDTPLDVCIARDPKGLYAKARTGQAPHVTGISSPYEPPLAPEIHLHTVEQGAEGSAADVVRQLVRAGIISR